MLSFMSHSEKQIRLFSDHFEKMGSDSRAMKGTYLDPRIPGDMANRIYLTRKSLRHDNWRRRVYNGRTILQDLVPFRRRCPASPIEKVEKSMGTADHLMP